MKSVGELTNTELGIWCFRQRAFNFPMTLSEQKFAKMQGLASRILDASCVHINHITLSL